MLPGAVAAGTVLGSLFTEFILFSWLPVVWFLVSFELFAPISLELLAAAGTLGLFDWLATSGFY